MSRRDEVFRLRVTPEEQDSLGREAAERGLSKADLIRVALGWDARAPKAAVSSTAVVAALGKAPSGPKADPEREPGKAAIEALAKRISGGEGVPMRVARNRATERLKSAADAA